LISEKCIRDSRYKLQLKSLAAKSAILSPPRLPAFGGAFNADAWKGSCRASTGAAGYGKFGIYLKVYTNS
ncbi:hypothetical protein Q4S19_18675, partial [Morganella morganii]